MSRVVASLCALLAVCALTPRTATAVTDTCTQRGVRILVVPFAEPPRTLGAPAPAPTRDALAGIGHNVGSVMALEVLLRLRAGPGLAEATAVWEPDVAAPVTTHTRARALATERNTPAQLVLWGTVLRYGEWLVVQPRLTVVPDAELRIDDDDYRCRRQTERWQVVLPAHLAGHPDRPAALPEVGLPRLDFDFEPLSLSAAVAARFADPAGLRIYRKRTPLRGDLGPLGAEARAIEQAPGALKVRSGGRVGWIDTAGLGRRNAVALDFVDGLIRLMREDYDRADPPLKRVAEADDGPAALRLDALLLRALIQLHRDRPAHDLLAAAEEIDPYSPAVARVRIARDIQIWLASLAPPGIEHFAWPDIPRDVRKQMWLRVKQLHPDDALRDAVRAFQPTGDPNLFDL